MATFALTCEEIDKTTTQTCSQCNEEVKASEGYYLPGLPVFCCDSCIAKLADAGEFL